MPIKSIRPNGCLALRLDLRGLSGDQLFSRSSTVTMPSFTSGSDDGVYPDARWLLNAGVAQVGFDWATSLDSAWTGAGAITIGIDENDKLYLESDTEDFTITAGDMVQFGFTQGATGYAGGGAPFRHTADSDWLRGSGDQGEPWQGIKLNITASVGGAFVWNIPLSQDPVTGLRVGSGSYTAYDADDISYETCITTLDNDANDNVSRRIMWCVTESGHCAWYSTLNVLAPTWISTTLQAALGWSGNETISLSGTVYYSISDYPIQSMLFPRLGIRRTFDWSEHVRTSVEREDGRVGSTRKRYKRGWNTTVHVGGPADPTDLTDHFLDGFYENCGPGDECNVYRAWGDPRLKLLDREVTSSQDAYDLRYTSDDSAGRLEGIVSARQAQQRTHDWTSRDLDMASELQLRLNRKDRRT